MTKKIFAIYDLNVMPYSIGDIISFIAGIQTIRYKNNIESYDICFIANCDKESDSLFNKLISNQNRLHYYLKLVDTLQINDTLESIYYCHDYVEFHELYTLKNASGSLVWPELSAIQSKEYLHYRIYADLHFFKQEFGFIPSVFSSTPLTQWAHTFFSNYVNQFLPVTINLRINNHFCEYRNAHIDSWLEFFSYCHEKYPVKFIVICAKAEVDTRLYLHPNVIIAKNLNTSIAQDIALVANSLLHLGSASGPATISHLVSHPCLITNCDMMPHMDLYHGALQFYRDDKHVKFSFSHPFQFNSTFPESTDYLIDEFNKLWNAVDVEAWKQVSRYWLDNKTEATLSWLD